MDNQSSDTTGARVLVVDDQPSFGREVDLWAAVFIAQTRCVTDLTAAVREVTQWRPHLILLDLHIPKDDNWEPVSTLKGKYTPTQNALAFCKQVTSDPALSNTVVAVVSVEDQPAQIELALKAGAHAFYTKGKNFGIDEFEYLLEQARSKIQVA